MLAGENYIRGGGDEERKHLHCHLQVQGLQIYQRYRLEFELPLECRSTTQQLSALLSLASLPKSLKYFFKILKCKYS